MDKKLVQIIHATFRKAFLSINPALTNYTEFSKKLATHIKTKPDENEQYNFDVALDEVFNKEFSASGHFSRAFSEESGWQPIGHGRYIVIYDPFCNSTLATKTFLDAAVGASIFDERGGFVTSAIMDYQTGLMAIIEDGRTIFYQIQSGDKMIFGSITGPQILADAFIVITLESRREREHLPRVSKIFSDAKRIVINSGHIYWLRLATKMIDGYLDPVGGEPLYEMFACTIAQASGCTVTDLSGRPFDPAENLIHFEKNPQYLYYPVAATSAKLHREILQNITR